MRQAILLVIVLGLLCLYANQTAACRPIVAVGRIASVERTIHPLPWPVRWTVGGWTFSEPTYIFLTTTRTRFSVGERVIVQGCLDRDEIRQARLSPLYR